LLNLHPSERALITKLRCSNLKIPVETGRWVNITREERICHLCHNDIGSEYNFIFESSFPNVIDIRKKRPLPKRPTFYQNNPTIFQNKCYFTKTPSLLYCQNGTFNKRISTRAKIHVSCVMSCDTRFAR
jgi:hypothetical protein